MAWKKSSQELIELFDSVQPGPPAEPRRMFGYPACFVNGNLFMGLHEERFILRLAEEDRKALARQGARPFEPMPGKPMREYVVLPERVLGDRTALQRWVSRALEHGSSLPPKAPKARAKSKAAKKPAKRPR